MRSGTHVAIKTAVPLFPKDTSSITIISDYIMISGKVKALLNIFESHIIWEKIMRTHNIENDRDRYLALQKRIIETQLKIFQMI